jgi:hypothetical protein
MTTETNSFDVFAKACRHNSGSHFLDSGDAYGRHWQKPAIARKDGAAVLDVWRDEITGTIETAHFLAEHMAVDADMQAQFEEWSEGQAGSWFELAEKFATEHLGLVQRARDNVYNGENDLTQVYIWEVYTPEDDGRDWIFDNDALTVIFVHTGCDVRGGYSAPIFCRTRGEYSVPVDLCAQFYAAEARDEDGNEIEDPHTLDEKWRCGWASHPASQLREDIERVFGFTKTATTVCAKLHTGEIVKIGVEAPLS